MPASIRAPSSRRRSARAHLGLAEAGCQRHQRSGAIARRLWRRGLGLGSRLAGVLTLGARRLGDRGRIRRRRRRPVLRRRNCCCSSENPAHLSLDLCLDFSQLGLRLVQAVLVVALQGLEEPERPGGACL